MIYRLACRLAQRSAEVFAHPLAIVGLLLASVIYWHVHRAAIGAPGVFALSVFQDRDTRALHAKLDAIIHGTAADDSIAGIERH